MKRKILLCIMVALCIFTFTGILFAAGKEEEVKEAVEEYPEKAPYVVDFSWGTFKLSPRIVKKIENNEPLNFVLSYQTLSSVAAAQEHEMGMLKAAEWAEEEYGVKINVRLIGPTETDAPKQIAEIESILNANQADVLSIQPPSKHGFEAIIQKGLDMGVPVVTCNSDAPDSTRIAYYGPNDTPSGNGITVAKHAQAWAKENGFNFDSIAITTGDTTAVWAQGRMGGFFNTVQKDLPGVKIYGTPTNAAVSTGWNSTDMYTKIKAFLTGHPDVNFIFNSDWGGVSASQAVIDLGREGECFVIAYNTDEKILSFVGKGTTYIATADQDMPGQSEAWVKGMARFLFEGEVPDGPMQYTPVMMVTSENADEVRKDLEEMGVL